MGGTVSGPNREPHAAAGRDNRIEPGQRAILDGTGSWDPDLDPINYEWEIVAAPDGATAQVYCNRCATAELFPDKEGIWVVTLKVSDGDKQSIDATEIRVEEKTAALEPDVGVTDVVIDGIYEKDKLERLFVEFTNTGAAYTGPLDVEVMLATGLFGGGVEFSKLYTIDFAAREGDTQRKLMVTRDIVWPTNVCEATAMIMVDRQNKLHDINTKNNFFYKQLYRGDAILAYSPQLEDTILITGKLPSGEYFSREMNTSSVLPIPHTSEPRLSIRFTLSNCQRKNESLRLSFVFDWTPTKKAGLNRKLWGQDMVLKPGETKTIWVDVPFSSAAKYFTEPYEFIALLKYTSRGYDVLAAIPCCVWVK